MQNNLSMQSNLVGVVKRKAGLIFDFPSHKVIKKEGKAGDTIPKHNHPEAYIVFTIVKGAIRVILNDTEVYELYPGMILNFDGTYTIEAMLLEDSEAVVTLILK